MKTKIKQSKTLILSLLTAIILMLSTAVLLLGGGSTDRASAESSVQNDSVVPNSAWGPSDALTAVPIPRFYSFFKENISISNKWFFIINGYGSFMFKNENPFQSDVKYRAIGVNVKFTRFDGEELVEYAISVGSYTELLPQNLRIEFVDNSSYFKFGHYTFTCTVTYKADTGEKDLTAEFSDAFDIKRAVVPLPQDPVKEGHTFVEWCLDEALTIPYDGRPILEDMTLYAKFAVNKHTIILNTDGGNALDNIVLDWNTSPTLPTPERDGYNFLGWFNGDTEYDGSPVKEDMSLIAKWQIKVYSVTFKVDGVVYKTMDVEHGTSLIEALKDAGLKYYNISSVTVENGEFSGVVEDITEVVITAQNSVEKAWTFVKTNWIYFVAGFGALTLMTGVGLALSKRNKNKVSGQSMGKTKSK